MRRPRPKNHALPASPPHAPLRPAPTNTRSGKAGDGFDVSKVGDTRVGLIGFPSVGKSTLLTGTESEAASYEFTTLTCIPGVIHYKGTKIQLLDLPGIIEGAADGKGRGRQVIAVAKSADLVLMMLDATKPDAHREILEAELESTGIRLNKNPPDIYFKKKKTGGIKFNSMVPLSKMGSDPASLVHKVLQEYKVLISVVYIYIYNMHTRARTHTHKYTQCHNCEIVLREEFEID